jgi:hypothetical protein
MNGNEKEAEHNSSEEEKTPYEHFGYEHERLQFISIVPKC